MCTFDKRCSLEYARQRLCGERVILLPLYHAILSIHNLGGHVILYATVALATIMKDNEKNFPLIYDFIYTKLTEYLQMSLTCCHSILNVSTHS